MTILEAASALRVKQISSVELAKDTLARIARLNPKVNAFITVTEEIALARAKAADEDFARGVDRGSLQGVPVAHKDIIHTAGVRTTYGSKIFSDFVPDHDAEVAARLNEAGAVLVGKTGLHEFAYGITSNNPHYGAIRNPWDLERIPGGSSGGSGAAIAAGLVPLALGTDTGGSIRIPASFCGVTGLKPTFDLVSRRGVMALGFTLDHIGPMSRTVRDTAVALNAMAGLLDAHVPPEHVDIKGLRIGLPSNYFFECVDPEVSAAVRMAVQSAAALGARMVDLRVPDMDALTVAGRIVLLGEAAAALGRHADRRPDFGADVLALLDQGRLIPARDYIDAQRLRRVLAGEFSKVWTQVDCLMTPATPIVAPKIGQTTVELGGAAEDTRLASTRFARAFNALGIPAMSIPCGFTKEGLPVGLQIVGPPRREDTVLRLGAAIEDATGLTRRTVAL
jgi:aspartyl-tRNA(Asn)/glutamyl-tRNA(Gln) amidotransferase subunit A